MLALSSADRRRVEMALAAQAIYGEAEETPLPPADEWASMALGVELDPWQRQAMLSDAQTTLALCCRQAGKSTIIGCRAAYDALRYPGESSVATAPSYRQSRLLAAKIAAPLRRMGVRFSTDEGRPPPR